MIGSINRNCEIRFIHKHISNLKIINKINTTIKRPRLLERVFHRLTICSLQESKLKMQDTKQLEVKRWKMQIKKQTGIITLSIRENIF